MYYWFGGVYSLSYAWKYTLTFYTVVSVHGCNIFLMMYVDVSYTWESTLVYHVFRGASFYIIHLVAYTHCYVYESVH